MVLKEGETTKWQIIPRLIFFEIKSIAAELKSRSDDFAPVCDKLIRLADDFDFDGILNLAKELNSSG